LQREPESGGCVVAFVPDARNTVLLSVIYQPTCGAAMLGGTRASGIRCSLAAGTPEEQVRTLCHKSASKWYIYMNVPN
jgi:hypothetical protein